LSKEYIVADALNEVLFCGPITPQVRQSLNDSFAILPVDLDDLVNRVANERPDLLIGLIDTTVRSLTVIGGQTALDPCSSSIIKHVSYRHSINACLRHLFISLCATDSWETKATDMCGGIPLLLFHGTSDHYLAAIRRSGLTITGTPNWKAGGRHHVYLSASPQIAAFHARRTAAHVSGAPIVVACNRPPLLRPDWDVQNQLVNSAVVPSDDGATLAREAGLFASPAPILDKNIVEIRSPVPNQPYRSWPII
jgi:hypothetical protein